MEFNCLNSNFLGVKNTLPPHSTRLTLVTHSNFRSMIMACCSTSVWPTTSEKEEIYTTVISNWRKLMLRSRSLKKSSPTTPSIADRTLWDKKSYAQTVKLCIVMPRIDKDLT